MQSGQSNVKTMCKSVQLASSSMTNLGRTTASLRKVTILSPDQAGPTASQASAGAQTQARTTPLTLPRLALGLPTLTDRLLKPGLLATDPHPDACMKPHKRSTSSRLHSMQSRQSMSNTQKLWAGMENPDILPAEGSSRTLLQQPQGIVGLHNSILFMILTKSILLNKTTTKQQHMQGATRGNQCMSPHQSWAIQLKTEA